jgi:hypothetical protein
MQAVGLLRSVFVNRGTVATVPSKTQMTNKLFLNLRVSAADRRKKAVGEHVVYHMPHSLVSMSCPAMAFEQQPRNTGGAHHSACGIVVIAGRDTAG